MSTISDSTVQVSALATTDSTNFPYINKLPLTLDKYLAAGEISLIGMNICKGDGMTSDDANVTAVAAELSAAGGGLLVFDRPPGGSYLFTGPALIPDNVRCRGVGRASWVHNTADNNGTNFWRATCFFVGTYGGADSSASAFKEQSYPLVPITVPSRQVTFVTPPDPALFKGGNLAWIASLATFPDGLPQFVHLDELTDVTGLVATFAHQIPDLMGPCVIYGQSRSRPFAGTQSAMGVTIHAAGSGYSVTPPLTFTLSTGTGIDPPVIVIDTVDGSGAITACHIQYPGYYDDTATPSNPVSGSFSGGGGTGTGAQFDIVWTPNICVLARGTGLSNMRLTQESDGQVLHVSCYDGLFENLWLEGGDLISANPCAYTTFRNIVGKYTRKGFELPYLHNCVDIDGIDLARMTTSDGDNPGFEVQVSECGRDVTVRNFRISSYAFSGDTGQSAMQVSARRTKVHSGTVVGSQGAGVGVVSSLPISADDRSLMFDIDNVTVINPTTHGISIKGTRGKITGNRVLGTTAGSYALNLADGSEQCIIANNTLGYAGPNQVAYAAVDSVGTGYALGDTITLASGTCLTPAILTVATVGLYSCALNAAGSGYAPGDTVTLAGGTPVTKAELTVSTTKLVSVAVPLPGTGGGYAPGDGITLAGGTFSVAAAVTVSTTKVLSASVAAGVCPARTELKRLPEPPVPEPNFWRQYM